MKTPSEAVESIANARILKASGDTVRLGDDFEFKYSIDVLRDFAKIADSVNMRNSSTIKDADAYPANLVMTILNDGCHYGWFFKFDYKKIVADFDKNYAYVKEKFPLTENEDKAMMGTYRDGKTLAEIGKEIGLTRERVRQIVQRAVRKLGSPVRRDVIIVGMDEVEKREDAVAAYRKKTALMTGEPGDYCEDIDEMDLSVRSTNCLKRAGIITINDLVSYISKNGGNYECLSKIRNLGKRCENEIISKMAVFGIAKGGDTR